MQIKRYANTMFMLIKTHDLISARKFAFWDFHNVLYCIHEQKLLKANLVNVMCREITATVNLDQD